MPNVGSHIVRPLLTIVTFFFLSCNQISTEKKTVQSGKKITTLGKDIFPDNVYLINIGGCVYKDSIVVDSIGNNLYSDKKGNIYFKTADRSDPENDLPVLISRLYNGCEGDSTYDLKRHLDLQTFKTLGYGYYADKSNVYFFNSMSDGGNIGPADNIDAKTFKLLPKSYYGFDKNNVFFKGSKVELANRNTFQCIYKIEGSDTLTAWFGKDEKHYFDGLDTCSKQRVTE